jgi:hypothetical protein
LARPEAGSEVFALIDINRAINVIPYEDVDSLVSAHPGHRVNIAVIAVKELRDELLEVLGFRVLAAI